jgi:hypothetical protein
MAAKFTRHLACLAIGLSRWVTSMSGVGRADQFRRASKHVQAPGIAMAQLGAWKTWCDRGEVIEAAAARAHVNVERFA